MACEKISAFGRNLVRVQNCASPLVGEKKLSWKIDTTVPQVIWPARFEHHFLGKRSKHLKSGLLQKLALKKCPRQSSRQKIEQ
jgi:hypothetical protein